MDTSTVTVFISSKMVELAAERTALIELLPTLSNNLIQVRAWVYEDDAPASEHTIRENYLKALNESDLYIGIFWNDYSRDDQPNWTIDEYEWAGKWGIPQHVYVKDVKVEDKPRDPRLQTFLDSISGVTFGPAPKWFKTTEELCEAVKKSVKEWLDERVMLRAGSANAVLCNHPDDIPRKPPTLIGRADLMAQIGSLVQENRRILLQGFGGMGKTALASWFAAEWMKQSDTHSPALWLEIGAAQPDTVFESLARPFNAVQQIAVLHGDDKLRGVRQLLRLAGIKLVILDNAWDRDALTTVLQAMPSDVPVIVTSRQAYPIGVRLDVDELAQEKALETLGYYAAQPNLTDDPAASDLCKTLGYLAFALEIAGKTLNATDGLHPAELNERIKNAPHAMARPFSSEASGRDIRGRETVADLLDVSLYYVEKSFPQAVEVFLMFGAFFAPQVTSIMLSLCSVDRATISTESYPRYMTYIPNFDSLTFEELSHQIHFVQAQEKRGDFETLLEELMRRGLVKRVAPTEESNTAYLLHELAYSYTAARNTDDQRPRAFDACVTYTQLHNRPTPENFAALLPELDNFLGAVTWAGTSGYEFDIERLVVNLWAASEFLTYQGYFDRAVTLLHSAVLAARHRGNPWNESIYLSYLATAYRNLSDYDTAIELYEQSLAICRQIGNIQGEGNQLGNLGNTYFFLGNYQKAIELFQQALTIARLIRDKRSEGISLGGLGLVHRTLGNFQDATELFQQALAIAHQIGDRRLEMNQLGNLGNAHANLGDSRKGIYYNEQALDIARQIRDKPAEGKWLGNLGSISNNLGDYPKAVYYYEQALAIFRQIHDRRGEGDTLGNLGLSHTNMGNYPQAVEYYQEARGIFVLIGVQHKVEWIDGLIAEVHGKLAGGCCRP